MKKIDIQVYWNKIFIHNTKIVITLHRSFHKILEVET